MSEANEAPEVELRATTQLRQASVGLLRYVEDNPLAAVAGAMIVGVLLIRFAFLGNSRD